MPGLENQEWLVEFFYSWGTLPTHLVAPKKWRCDMMGFLTIHFSILDYLTLK